MIISIHAPAKGATKPAKELFADVEISIHAPAKGATEAYNKKVTEANNFNPRSREGSDKVLAQRTITIRGIFQSTLPRRERLESLERLPTQKKFQSTLPRRERHKSGHPGGQLRNFNPRSREGSDHYKSTNVGI